MIREMECKIINGHFKKIIKSFFYYISAQGKIVRVRNYNFGSHCYRSSNLQITPDSSLLPKGVEINPSHPVSAGFSWSSHEKIASILEPFLNRLARLGIS